MDEVNGKHYALWSQFVDRQKEWIGNTLEDYDNGMFASTKITGITLVPNGADSAFFSIVGEDFTCGFDVAYGGIIGGEKGWISFSCYGGHSWRISTQPPAGLGTKK